MVSSCWCSCHCRNKQRHPGLPITLLSNLRLANKTPRSFARSNSGAESFRLVELNNKTSVIGLLSCQNFEPLCCKWVFQAGGSLSCTFLFCLQGAWLTHLLCPGLVTVTPGLSVPFKPLPHVHQRQVLSSAQVAVVGCLRLTLDGWLSVSSLYWHFELALWAGLSFVLFLLWSRALSPVVWLDIFPLTLWSSAPAVLFDPL